MTRALALAAAALWTGCGPAGDEVVVFAAASTADVAEAAADRLGEEGRARVVVSAAASSTLARQIERGAPADVFLSADPTWVDWLLARGVGTERVPLATGCLVWVEPAGTPPRGSLAEAAAAARRVAVGDPAHVPAGRYARAALEAAGLWDALVPRLVPQADVRAALAAVETGRADAAVVYTSDARLTGRVVATASVPSPEAVRYEGLALTPRGAAVLDALRSETGRALWASRGFGPPER